MMKEYKKGEKLFAVYPVGQEGEANDRVREKVARDYRIIEVEYIADSELYYGHSVLFRTSVISISPELLFRKESDAKDKEMEMRAKSFDYLFSEVEKMKTRIESLSKIIKF